MSGNRSGEIIAFGDVRVAGFKEKDGTQHAGTFLPEHTNAAGTLVASMWKGKFLLNRGGYINAAGVEVKGKVESIWVTIWSQKGAGAKGLAEIFAKTVSVGKAMSFDSLRLNTFMKTLYIDGQPMAGPDGQVIKYPATGFTLDGNFRYGDDATRQVDSETSNYQGVASFTGRPPLWNVQGHADNAAWKAEIAARMGHAFDPAQPTYGYAKVNIPVGCTVGNPNVQNVPAGVAPTQAAAMVAPPVAPVTAPAVAAPLAQPVVQAAVA